MKDKNAALLDNTYGVLTVVVAHIVATAILMSFHARTLVFWLSELAIFLFFSNIYIRLKHPQIKRGFIYGYIIVILLLLFYFYGASH